MAFEWDDWKSGESNDFRGIEDQNMNESKIDILLKEIYKLGHQMEFYLLNFNCSRKNFN